MSAPTPGQARSTPTDDLPAFPEAIRVRHIIAAPPAVSSGLRPDAIGLAALPILW